MDIPHCFAFCCNNEYTLHTYIHDHALQHFQNHTRMLVVHFVATSKLNTTMKTRMWPTFIPIDISSSEVRRIVLT